MVQDGDQGGHDALLGGDGDEPILTPAADAHADDGMMPARKPWWRRPLFIVPLCALAVGLAAIWLWRKDVADRIIASQLAHLELAGSYEVESIGPGRQVLRNVVIGDPARPDLRVERVELVIRPRFGLPRIAQLILVRPHLYGVLREGRVSFGALDSLIYDTESTEPAKLPDLDLVLRDGRVTVASPYGALGAKAEGQGNLAHGFAGVFAAAVPAAQFSDCKLADASLRGALSTRKGRPLFTGPLRIPGLTCTDAGTDAGTGGGLSAKGFDLPLRIHGDADLTGADLEGRIAGGAWRMAGFAAGGSDGTFKASWRDGRLTGAYDVQAADFAANALRLGSLRVEGGLRGRDGLAVIEAEGTIAGSKVAAAGEVDQALAGLQASAAESLLAPLLARIRGVLKQEGRNGTLQASYQLRKDGERTSLIIPHADMRGASGAALLSLNRLQLGLNEGGIRHLSGNFATGGPSLPRMTGQMEQGANGTTRLRLEMPEYRAEDAHMALPELHLVMRPDGVLGFSGRLLASGALPGGGARGLVVPLSGDWSPRLGLSLWRKCVRLQFEQLAMANLALAKNTLDLCPSHKAPILQSDANGFRLAAGIPEIDMAGHLGETPLHIRSGAIGLAYPGIVTARQVDVTLGSSDMPSQFQLARLEAHLGGVLAGRFEQADIRLYPVPLNLVDGQGAWRYADGRLTLSDGAFRLEDRQDDAGFRPLMARDAVLTLENSQIAASALIREPESDRGVLDIRLHHNLENGSGRADLKVPDLHFDKGLQPDMLTRHALGVIANAYGVVTGNGEVVWDDAGVRSTGAFSTKDARFAAAFGPASGVTGTIRFSDLIGMTTEPDQKIHIASINPGVEAHDGTLTYQIEAGEIVRVKGAVWPFLGGTLRMRPALMHVGVAEVRHYVLDLEGVDAAQFLAQMDMGNISATGVFDGTLPLVFDENGGWIKGGSLVSRAPGGNVSYVGELTYEDLSPIANYAFDTLRSLDYQKMVLDFDGSLTGEIITRVRIDGISQGEGAKSNFVTRRLARLPIRFNINVRAPFYKLATSIRAMYDPAFIRDPREVGLLDRNGNRVTDPQPGFLLPLSSGEGDAHEAHAGQ